MVAEAAGVSRSAVSRAFTKGAYLDAQKREKIKEVAAQLGYQPNALAAGLQGGRSNLVAIFAGNLRSPYDTAFISRIVQKMNALNKWPILIDGAGAEAEKALTEVLRYPLDALILRGGSMPAGIVERCAKANVPAISSGRLVDAPGVDNVCCRNARGMRLAGEMLIRKGRRRFAFIGGPEDFYSSAERRAGLLEALKANGLALVAEARGDYTVESGQDLAERLLQRHAVDALLCANDAAAIGALTAARQLGLDVPGDLSLVGFDDISLAKWQAYNLTTVRNPIDESVNRIIELLQSRLETPAKPSETVFVDPFLVLRGTH